MTKEERYALYAAREPHRLELLTAARAGDRGAAAELLKEYGGFVGALMKRTGALRVLGYDEAQQVGLLAILLVVHIFDAAKGRSLSAWMWCRIKWQLYAAMKDQCGRRHCQLIEEIQAATRPRPPEVDDTTAALLEEVAKLTDIDRDDLDRMYGLNGWKTALDDFANTLRRCGDSGNRAAEDWFLKECSRGHTDQWCTQAILFDLRRRLQRRGISA